MIAEKAADMVREKDTVRAIKEYFKHLLEIKHKKYMEEEETAHNRTDKKWSTRTTPLSTDFTYTVVSAQFSPKLGKVKVSSLSKKLTG